MTAESTGTSGTRTMESLITDGQEIIRNINKKANGVFLNKNQCNCLARRFTKLGEALEAVKDDTSSSLEESDIEEKFLPVLKKGVTLVGEYETEGKALESVLARSENKKSFEEIHGQLDNLKSILSWSDDEIVTTEVAAKNDRDANIQDLQKLDPNVKKVVFEKFYEDGVPEHEKSYLHIEFKAITLEGHIKKVPKVLNEGDEHLNGKAVVHKGQWIGCECAIKEFKSSDKEWNMEELKKEVASLVKLRHPHITQLIGRAQDADKTYVLYEKMDGDLRQLMKDRINKKRSPFKPSAKPRPFSPAEELSIIRQIAQGMFYLHQHGIVHGELKCTNVLVKQAGDNINVKVSDFHCSRELGSNERYKPKHRVRWLPPEAFKYLDLENPPVHQPTPDVLKQGDVYSFAMTCCEVVTGGYPFDGIERDVVKGMILKKGRPELPDHLSNSKLEGLIIKCWSQIPEERPLFEEVCYILLNIADLPMPPRARWRPPCFNAPAAGVQPVHDQKDESVSEVSRRRSEDIVNDWLQIFNVEPVKGLAHDLKIDPSNLEPYLKIDPSNLEPVGNSPLGKGSSAEVWEATWLGCKFAVKWLKSDHVSKLQKEVGIMTKLLHPHVVRLVGFSVLAEANRCAIVMELMDKSLEDLITEKMKEMKEKNSAKAPFSEREAIAIITQLAKGMNFMHSRDKPHCDLKCANVLVRHVQTKNGKNMDVHVKLVDFGLVYLDKKDLAVVKNGPCQPPEVQLQQLSYDPKAADVYSFGMMCWEIITGKSVMPHPRKQAHSNIRKELWILLNDCWKDSLERPAFPKICERLAAMSPKARSSKS